MKKFLIDFWMPISALILVSIFWASSFYIIKMLTGGSISNMGLVGDTFGSINALFSGLAFALLIYTIYLQRKDLEISKEELRLTRDELRRTAEAQSEQVNQMQRAAKINALTCIINHHSTLAGAYAASSHGIARNTEIEKARRNITILEELIK